jgi:hypothetical protein
MKDLLVFMAACLLVPPLSVSGQERDYETRISREDRLEIVGRPAPSTFVFIVAGIRSPPG